MRGLLRKSRSPGLPPLLPSLQEGRLRGGGGSRGAPGVASHEASSPPARSRFSKRGGSVSGRSSVVRERALSLQLLRELQRGRLLGRSRLPLTAPLPRLLLLAHRSTLCDMMSREKLRRSAPVLDPPVFPDLRIEEQGKIVEPALGWTALVTVAAILALALLTARG